MGIDFNILTQEKKNALISNIVNIHRRLLLLRNFAVLNHIGFTKILKKHDKLTGFETRGKYMINLVNSQPFSTHNTLQRVLSFVMDEYRDFTTYENGSDLEEHNNKELFLEIMQKVRQQEY